MPTGCTLGMELTRGSAMLEIRPSTYRNRNGPPLAAHAKAHVPAKAFYRPTRDSNAVALAKACHKLKALLGGVVAGSVDLNGSHVMELVDDDLLQIRQLIFDYFKGKHGNNNYTDNQ